MLALPLVLDQPAVAARLQALGVAEVLSARCSEDEIRAAVLRLTTDSRYRDLARAMQAQLRSLNGTEQAASIVEKALADHRQIMPLPGEEMTAALQSR